MTNRKSLVLVTLVGLTAVALPSSAEPPSNPLGCYQCKTNCGEWDRQCRAEACRAAGGTPRENDSRCDNATNDKELEKGLNACSQKHSDCDKVCSDSKDCNPF